MFEIKYTLTYLKIYKKYIQNNQKLVTSINKTLQTLSQNPFDKSLKSHKVDTRRNKDVWSSSISGDWRLIWVFDEESKVATIICLELGTHSGSNQIYTNKSS
jgi:mRNA-degrading endonuclease YafQ of YafQ-DinJ toxin-antitoxin module